MLFFNNSFFFFIKTFTFSLLGERKAKIAISDLFQKFSYRYTEVEMKSFLSPLRYLKSSVTLLWKAKRQLIEESKIYTIDLSVDYYIGDKKYLEALGILDNKFIFRDQLPNTLKLTTKIVNSLFLLIFFFAILPFSFFVKDTARISLLLLEMIEVELIGKALDSAKARELIVFSAFEKDTMFLALFLWKSHRIHVKLIPSSNPISTLYKQVICHTFVFTSPYQKDEYESLKANWFVSNTEFWPPYGFTEVVVNQRQNQFDKHSVGIISSGMALRDFLKHPSEYDKLDFLAEKDMIAGIKRLFENKVINQPIIYLHPLEKSSPANLEFSLNYYRSIFGSDVKFSPIEESSKSNFWLCNIGISVYSSAQTERLYGGYKVIFAPMGHLKNFFPGETFQNISAQSFENLDFLVERMLAISDETYFDFYHLAKYKWDTFPKYLVKGGEY